MSPKFVLLLGAMSGLGAVTIDMYLPSMPDVATDLGVTTASAQLTISAVLVGGAIGQLLVGPMSDRFGRRAPVLVGIGLHVVASLLCLVAPGLWPLVVLRVIQGVGNASAQVVAMAVIRDRFTGGTASAILSRLMLVIGVAPLLAPTVGGAIAGVAGWRAVFAVLAGLGLLLMLAVWKFLPETLPTERRRTDGLRGALRSYGVLVRDRHFLVLAILPGLAMAALMAYVAGSPFILREGYGLSENQFALLFAAGGIGLVAAAQVNAAIVRRFAPIRIIRLALPASLLACVALLVVALTGAGGIVGLVIPLWAVIAINGFVPPNASAIALSRHGERAGAAAATIGAVQAAVAATASPIVGVLGGDAVAMATVMVGSILLALVVLALATPAYRRGGWAEGAAA
ncbi:drug resistance transporter, Bcr/CflA subfamily [Beutenbergia cavernae DSM 12333]|uniref:Drug resistance transporter, Bcr/CflA subfamily n=1 Tax=Beutenbergia cavernae (strain ATCC BAA-8 / DSM 12333 / CCUG 43141 / JCM 11478 / NBRC 16432 / NCIMB 13614 / HKI 0122) TaxID=471853 RepID=C5BYC5_BEUC1|nr:drug resistance transporter, Bcr/CflA subfamily [Beutenbergia cavernae DSM 12333]